ncbi:Alpha-tubulin suppressor [Flavobacterium caeni]|uniref:Alpha-tubulin suppressor n=2 Tax=Flavobacterium caeni TaxID=490189 RepID=A0A1G5GWM3_9FLAO|nr:Alpha-tubulin suppressor [Flavobacterium caeni]
MGNTMKVREISTSGSHTLAIQTDGTLWVWGNNSSGGFANGVKNGSQLSTPIQIGLDNDWKLVVAGSPSFAIKNNGTLWGWGQNNNGQLGIGNQTDTYVLTQIGTDSDWKTVDSGSNMTIAQKTDGTLWGWGSGTSLGMGTQFALDNQNVLTPFLISTDTDWKQFSANLHVLAVKNNGELWAWGNDLLDVFGNPGQLITHDRVRVGTDSDWSQVAVSQGMSMAIKSNGALYTWGSGQMGSLGRAGSGDTPGQVGTDSNWISIAAGYYSCLALKSDGSVWAWGLRANGGGANNLYDAAPVQPNTDTHWTKVAMGGGLCYVVKSDQALYGWGARYHLFGYANDRPADNPVPMHWPL